MPANSAKAAGRTEAQIRRSAEVRQTVFAYCRGEKTMTVKKIKYFVTIFYPDKDGLFELPEDSIAAHIEDDGGNTRVSVLVPFEEDTPR